MPICAQVGPPRGVLPAQDVVARTSEKRKLGGSIPPPLWCSARSSGPRSHLTAESGGTYIKAAPLAYQGGTARVLMPGPRGLEWTEVHAGDYVQVPQDVRHAHRNVSGEPLIELVITTARLGRWFQEAGTPLTDAPRQPTREDLARLIAVSAKYGYWLGSPEEIAPRKFTCPNLRATATSTSDVRGLAGPSQVVSEFFDAWASRLR